jgi:hypothetical protein
MSKLRQAAEQEPVECMCGICKLGKREWVGLTDDDYEELLRTRDWGVYLIEAVEVKLKEKNNERR